MPTRADIAAATPSCLIGTNVPGWRRKGVPPCGRPLRYDASEHLWTCPTHGVVQTPQSLVAGQTPSRFYRDPETGRLIETEEQDG